MSLGMSLPARSIPPSHNAPQPPANVAWQWPTWLTTRASVTHWTPSEDESLLDAISRYGPGEWTLIAKAVGHNRTRSQCAQRWVRCLNPTIVKGPWTPAEDETLLTTVKLFGRRCWAQVARELHTRTDVQCQHRYTQLTQKERPAPPRIKLPSIDIFSMAK
jgi:hypothetical protein